MTFGPCLIAATHAIAKSHFLQYRGPEHEGREARPSPASWPIRSSIHTLDSPGQTGQDTPYRGVSVMSGNVRPDKTTQRSLILLRFFLSDRTNQRKNRTNGHVRLCPADQAEKGFFVWAGASPISCPCPSRSRNHIKISLCLPPISDCYNITLSPACQTRKSPACEAGLIRLDCVQG